jgi:hypothetical protein
MPYEEALSALELAAVLPCGDERRARAAAADKLLAEMRCPRDLERLRLVG